MASDSAEDAGDEGLGYWECDLVRAPAGRTPSSQELDAFVERLYVCHRCGRRGGERRDTDLAPGPWRYRFGSDRILLPCCPGCCAGRDARWAAVTALERAMEFEMLAWVHPRPLPVYSCPVRVCGRRWHHLGAPLPLAVVEDPHSKAPHRGWHSCPWCVADDPDIAITAHHARAQAVTDLRRWEDELRGPSAP